MVVVLDGSVPCWVCSCHHGNHNGVAWMDDILDVSAKAEEVVDAYRSLLIDAMGSIAPWY